MQIHACFSRLGGRGRKHREPFRNDMAIRQSEHCRVGEQQIIFILMQRLRQSSRCVKRKIWALKDVIVSLSLVMRFISPTRNDEKGIPFYWTGVIKRLLDVRLADFFSIPCADASHRSRPQEQFLDGYLV